MWSKKAVTRKCVALFAVPHLIMAALRCLRNVISAADDTPAGLDEILRSRSLGILRLHDGVLVPVRRLHAASSRQLSCGLNIACRHALDKQPIRACGKIDS